MLIYNPKPSLSGTPLGDGAPKGLYDAGDLSPAKEQVKQQEQQASVTELLPHKDGSKVLNSPEVASPQKTQEAAKKLAALMTPQVLDAIPKEALAKYLAGLLPLLVKDKQAKWADVLDFMTRLRMWPDLNALYMQASGEILADDTLLVEMAQSVALKAGAVVPPDPIAGLNGQVHKMILSLPDKVKAVLKARYNMLVEQHSSKNSLKFPLYEWHTIGPTLEGAEWAFPVALAPRVAKVVEYTGQDGKKYKTLLYPLPSKITDEEPSGDTVTVWGSGTHPDVRENSSYSVADYMPYESYEYLGMDKNNPKAWETWLGTFHSLGKTFFGEYDEDLSRSADNYLLKRLTASGETEDFYKITRANKQSRITNFDPQFKAGAQSEYLINPSVRSVGDEIASGLSRDPEWGAKSYIQNYTVREIADYAGEATPGGFIKTLTKHQDNLRAKIMAPFALDGVGAQYSQYKAALANLRMAIATICYGVPPLDWKWTKKGLLLTPTEPDWDAWTDATSLKNPLGNALYAKLKSTFTYSFKGKADLETLTTLYAVLIDMLKDSQKEAKSPFWDWDPTLGPFLKDLTSGQNLPAPFAFNYPLDGMLSAATPVAKQAAEQAIAGLSKDQRAIVGIRSNTKASILLAMKATELGQEYLSKAQDLVESIKALCITLYGCNPSPPPPDTPTEKWVGWYESQLEACKQSPSSESLYGLLSALLAQYKDLKDKADKGDNDALQQLPLIGEQINAIQQLILELTGALSALMENGVDSAGSKQSGALDWIILSDGFLGLIDPEGKVQFEDGTEANLPPNTDEAAAANATADENKKIEEAAKNLLAYLAANAKFLSGLLKNWHLPEDPILIDNLTDSANTADDDLPDEKPKQSWWWLLLVAGALAASRKHK